MKILVTGFECFGGESINPSWEVVKLLPEEISGAKIIKKQLPTEFLAGEGELLAAIEENSPDMVLCTGQAAGRGEISIERVAINLRDASIADNRGYKPADEEVLPEGDKAYFTTLPVKAMLEALKAAGIKAALSLSAGSYVCNDVFYTLLRSLEPKGVPGGFIHLPLCPEQAEKKEVPPPSMALEEMARGLEIALAAAIKETEI